MFRTDRDALSDKVAELSAENQRLRTENEAMRGEILARRAADPGFSSRNAIYKTGALHDADRVALARHRLETFPIWATVLTHVLTLGLASLFRFNGMHDRLPKIEHDDPSAIKSIGLLLVPYFNLYWVFFNGLRLTDRLNLQLRLRDEDAGVSREWVIGAGVASVIPYVNLILAPIVWLVVAIQMQRAVNRIVELDVVRAAAGATQVRLPEVAAGVGIDPTVSASASAPGSSAALDAELEAEAEAILAEEAHARMTATGRS